MNCGRPGPEPPPVVPASDLRGTGSEPRDPGSGCPAQGPPSGWHHPGRGGGHSALTAGNQSSIPTEPRGRPPFPLRGDSPPTPQDRRGRSLPGLPAVRRQLPHLPGGRPAARALPEPVGLSAGHCASGAQAGELGPRPHFCPVIWWLGGTSSGRRGHRGKGLRSSWCGPGGPVSGALLRGQGRGAAWVSGPTGPEAAAASRTDVRGGRVTSRTARLLRAVSGNTADPWPFASR